MNDPLKTNERVAAYLFDYLKDILFNPDKAELDLSKVSQEQRLLAQGLMQLNVYMREEKAFAEGLSKGNLDVPLPAPDNPLTGELRDLHSSMSHLVWQSEQVTKGDYTQRLDFMGSISDVFNDMIEALDDRETKLAREAQIIQRQNVRLNQGQELHTTMMELMEDWVIVSGKVDGRIFHMNKSCQDAVDAHPDLYQLLSGRLRSNALSQQPNSVNHWELSLDVEDGEHKVVEFEVSSLPLEWDKQEAVVSILHDVTREREVEYYAYHDSLTGLFNRRHAIDEMSDCFEHGRTFMLGFVDLDGLKLINDVFGHESGNCYINDLVRLLMKVDEPKTISRMGGDEFLVIYYGDGDLKEELEKLRTEFMQESVEYPRSFSYGISDSMKYDNDLPPMINVSAILEDVDSVMYRYKVKNKANRRS